MLIRWHAVFWWLILIWLCPVEAMCPSECTCRQSEKGRRKITCIKGGMVDPIPTSEMSPDMEVLEISAPDTSWNILSIGPIFQNFKSLEELHVSRSGLLQLGMHAFWGVPTLKVLNLSFNNISTVLDHNFRGLANLVELNLERNRIDRLPVGAFRHLSELKVLNLEWNSLTELVPRLFVKLSKLEVLKISFNPLIELDPEVFKDVPELRSFQCRQCGLRRINTQMYHLLPYLSHLDLGNNQIQFIDADEFVDLHRLRVLYLDGNQLPVVLERTFVTNVHLRVLCLARNRLAKITTTAFTNLTNLLELDIGYNKLDKLEAVTVQPIAIKLQRLILSGNQFPVQVIKMVLEILQNLEELSLADMNLKEYPISVIPKRVRFLNFSGNHFVNLSAENFPVKIVSLDVSRNKLRGLDERAIMRLENLQEVRVENNTWVCDLCHISSLLFRVNKSQTFTNSICSAPSNLKGRLIKSLSYPEVKECGEGAENESEFATFVKNKLGLIIGGGSLVLFLVLCVLFVVIMCVRRHSQRRHPVIKEAREVPAATAIFVGGKAEISFKFPLDLPDRTLSVSTIDDMKKDTQIHNTLPNGTGI